MRCRTATVKDAGSTEEQCAGADRADSPDTSRYLFEPSDYFNGYLVVLDGGATSDKQRVDLAQSISPRTSRNVLCAVIRNPQFVIIAVRDVVATTSTV